MRFLAAIYGMVAADSFRKLSEKYCFVRVAVPA